MGTGNKHKTLKFRSLAWILSYASEQTDRQTDRQTDKQKYSSQYFAPFLEAK